MADVSPRVPATIPADSDAFVIRSGVRSGLKRELAFALKAQAEILASPRGRTRSGKIPRSPGAPRSAAAKRPRTAEGAGAAPKGGGSHAETDSAAPGGLEASADNVIVLDADDRKMRSPAADAAHSVVQESRETFADVPVRVEADLRNPVVTPPLIQAVERTMEVAVSSVQAGDKPVAGNPSEVGDRIREKEEESIVPKPTKRFTRSSLRAAADETPAPERHSRRFTRSLLKTAVAAPQPSVVEMPPSAVERPPPTVEIPPSAVDVPPSAVEIPPSAIEIPPSAVEIPPSAVEIPPSAIEIPPSAIEIPPSAIEIPPSAIEIPPSAVEMPPSAVEMPPAIEIPPSAIEIPPSTIEIPPSVIEIPPSAIEIPPSPIEIPLSAIEIPHSSTDPGPSSAANGRSDERGEAQYAADTATDADERLRTTPKKKMELKMSKKIALTKVPSNIKELLATGLLEGMTVNYVSRSHDKHRELRGIIKDVGILCFCASCKGLNTVTAYNFELHAGSAKKHPSDNIYLENGSSLHDVIRACSGAPLDMLEATIQSAIGPAGAKLSKCHKCKESSDQSHIGKLTSVCESCLIARLSPMNARSSQEIIIGDRHAKSFLTSNSSDTASKSISSQKKSGRGRMTTKDLRLHKLVFVDGILPDGTEVAYYARGQRLLEGYIKENGIYCHCCNAVVSPSQFEAHAGWASRRKPYLNIYTSNGVSLHELAISLSKDKKFSTIESDDLCRICADGGDLLLCDLCPRAFHKECVGLKSVPKGDWYCPCCQNMHQKEKFVEHNRNAIAAGRVAGADPIEEIYKKSIRIIKTPETDVGSCVLCRCHDFNKNGFGPRTVMLCDQCEREYHVGCLKDHNMADLKELPEGEWFCSSDCIRIHEALQNLLASESEHLPGLLADIIKRKCNEKDIHKDNVIDVRWRILSGRTASSATRLLLSETVSIFHESFNPIMDSATKKDLIPEMVFGMDSRDQEFGGMCCAVLTVNNSVVSAGILRVLGCEVAELPLVATSRESQGKGYFQTLFLCIERMLSSLNVKHLVLPAATEAESIWINKFGFSKVSAQELLEYTKGSRTMVFHGTSMLHKLVPKFSTYSVQQEET